MNQTQTAVHVLLVEDDEMLRETTALVLERQGFTVSTASDGVEGLDALRRESFDVAVVDVMMPRMDGITFARKVREGSDLPIVLLTARDLPHDQLAGFQVGVDDYVTKPFDGEVLAARLRAVLRRVDTVPEEPANATIRVADLSVNRDGMVVKRAGETVSLSATEFRLLEVLLDHRGRVLSRHQLLEMVWDIGSWGDTHVVEVTVQRLRRKIGAERIVTVRGAGYKLVDA